MHTHGRGPSRAAEIGLYLKGFLYGTRLLAAHLQDLLKVYDASLAGCYPKSSLTG